nr:hypothetical protein [Paraburkholderia sp. XV]
MIPIFAPPHVVSPAANTERLHEIQQLVAAHSGGDSPPEFATTVIQAVPVQAGGLYPVSDMWAIAPALDDPLPLRTHIAQLAREIAAEANVDACVVATDQGIGYSIDDIGPPRISPLPFFCACGARTAPGSDARVTGRRSSVGR